MRTVTDASSVDSVLYYFVPPQPQLQNSKAAHSKRCTV